MPGCAAVGCSNSARKGMSMRHFPKDPERRRQWLIRMRRDNWEPNDHSCLCEAHFAPEMWEKTRVDGRRKLKFNAIPTIFFSSPAIVKGKSPCDRASRAKIPKSMLNLGLKISNSTEACESEMENQITIKEGDLVPDIGFDCEEKLHSRDNATQVDNEAAVPDDLKVKNKLEVKEEALVLDTGFENKEGFPSLEAVQIKNNISAYSNVSEIKTKMEIKDESLWQERTSLEVKCQLKASSVSDLQMQNEMRDEVDANFSPAESSRLYMAAVCMATPALFISEDLEAKDNLKLRKNSINFKKANTCEANGHDVLELSCKVQSDHLFKSEKSDEYKRNEIYKRCNDNGKKLYVCQICKKSFTLRGSLQKHILIHEGKRPYKCNFCEKSFIQRSHIRTHLLIHEGKRPYKCNVCEKRFTQKGHMKAHILTHDDKRPYKCDFCEKSYTQRGHMKIHISTHNGKKPYKCDTCEKRFFLRNHLNTHSLIHDKKRYSCEICEKGFVYKANLKNHILIHEGKRPYRCDVCEKSFTQRSHLNTHVQSHESQRLFKCDDCGKRFNQKRILKTHILIHAAKKPYKCDVCEKGFIQSGNYKTHMLIHEGIRPYICDICNKSFTQKRSMKTHILKHENEL